MGNSIKAWIQALRLRTLPLAVAAITLGACLAFFETGIFSAAIYLLALLTGFLLQILSNLANDYGDFKSGADGAERTDRALASGSISEEAMLKGLIICGTLCLFSGLLLLWIAFGNSGMLFTVFLLIGLAAIAAAVTYTIGKRPYGYAGWGDLFVFIFFGFAAVAGVYCLIAPAYMQDAYIAWASAAMGFLCVGVLNINNIRDIETDASRGKYTIPVKLGRSKALLYHKMLLYAAHTCFAVYVFITYKNPLQLLFLITIPIYIAGIRNVRTAADRPGYNRQLKKLSLLNLATALLFGISHILSC